MKDIITVKCDFCYQESDIMLDSCKHGTFYDFRNGSSFYCKNCEIEQNCIILNLKINEHITIKLSD